MKHTELHLKGVDADLIVMAAMRYCMGRRSYIVSTMVDFLIANWDNLSDSCKSILKRDLEEAFERDDEDRARGREFSHLGDNIDRVTWERVRELYNDQ
jgi:hypothetical protein